MERNFNEDRRFKLFGDKLTSNHASNNLIIETSYNSIDFSSNAVIFDGHVDFNGLICNNIAITNVSELSSNFVYVDKINLPANNKLKYNSVNNGYVRNTLIGYNPFTNIIGRSDAYFTYINVSGGDSSFNTNLYINKNLRIDGTLTISNDLLINGNNFASVETSFNIYRAALEDSFYSTKIITKDLSASAISISNNLVVIKTAYFNDISINGLLLNNVLKVPNIFTIDPSGHGNASGTLIINGDLIVKGVQTSIASSIVDICDLAITLASNLANRLDLSNANAGLDISNVASLKYNGTTWNFSGGQLTVENKKVMFLDDVSSAKRNFDLSVNAYKTDFSSSFFTLKRNIDNSYNATYTRFQIDNSFIFKSNFDLSLTSLRSYVDSSYISTNQLYTSFQDIITLMDKSYEAKNNRVGGALCVAVGSGINSIAYSYDGISWKGIGSSIFSVQGNGVAWNGTIWIAVGQGTNSIAYSYDGINWYPVLNSTTLFSIQGNSVAWNGNSWVAVGEGTKSIAYSYNGINWSSVTSSSSIFSSGNGVVWNGTRWVAVGDGPDKIAYSLDVSGISWVPVYNSSYIFTIGNGIAWNGTRLVAVGVSVDTQISIVHSNNGINWYGAQNISNIFSAGNGVAWNGTNWIALGYGRYSIAYSQDGNIWQGVQTSTFSIGNGVAWNGCRWIAVGNGTNTIAYSTDGINWSGAENNNNIFSIEGYGVAWNGIINSFYVSFASFTEKLDMSYILNSVFDASHNKMKIDFDNSFASINTSVITIETINTPTNKTLSLVPSTTTINTTISGDLIVGGNASLKSFRISNKHIFDVSVNGYSSNYFATSDVSASIVDYYSNVGYTYNRVFRIDACGNITNYSGSYSGVSDSRLKENIVNCSPKLEKILKVRVVNYNLKGSDKTKYIGLIAQELEEVFPELVAEDKTHERIKSVNYSTLTIMLIKAFQEQQVLINNLNMALEELEN